MGIKLVEIGIGIFFLISVFYLGMGIAYWRGHDKGYKDRKDVDDLIKDLEQTKMFSVTADDVLHDDDLSR